MPWAWQKKKKKKKKKKRKAKKSKAKLGRVHLEFTVIYLVQLPLFRGGGSIMYKLQTVCWIWEVREKQTLHTDSVIY